MIIGTGLDIVNLNRIKEMIEKHGDTFLERTYTEAERAIGAERKNFVEFFAGRFAAKEAAFKALGTGVDKGVGWLTVEILRNDLRAPIVHLHRGAKKRAEELGATTAHVSITHTNDIAAATVILEKA